MLNFYGLSDSDGLKGPLYVTTKTSNALNSLRLKSSLVILIGVGLTLVSLLFYHKVESQWRYYSKDIYEVYYLHDDLV